MSRSGSKRPLRAGPLAFGVSLLLLAQAARGAGVNELRAEVAELEQQARTLAIRHRTQAATSEQLAEHRLVDAQVLYNLRDYSRAAIVLLDYVAKYRNTRGYPEALFFLADSLYHKGDLLSARRYYQKIVNEVRGQYYQEALQRLIELSLRTGNTAEVGTYLAALANIPPHELKPSVPYVKGKYFFFAKRTDEAIAAFNELRPGQQYYMHAQYFIGASLVRKRDHAAAAKVFAALLRAKPQSAGEKQIVELTHLALGRLLYERGKIGEAIDAYQKVSRRAKEFDTALYEICWAYIKAGKFDQALRALDLLLLAEPDSSFAPEVRVLQGNLLIRLGQWGRATELFTGAREKFLPVHRRMNQLLAEQRDPNVFFDTLLARNEGNLAVSVKIPPVATRWVKELPQVRRALTLVQDVREINSSLEEIRRLIERLERAVSSPSKIKIFPEFATAKASALEVENRLAVARRQILTRERELVGNAASGSERAQLDAAASQRAALEERIKALPTTAEGYESRRRTQVSQLGGLEKQLSEQAVMIEHLQAQIVAAEKYFLDTGGGKTESVRQSFRREVADVRTMIQNLRTELEGLRQQVQDAKDATGVGGPEEVAERSLKQQYRAAAAEEHRVLTGLRGRLGGAAAAELDALAGLLARCDGVDSTLTAFGERLDAEVEQKLAAIKAVLVEEQELTQKHGAEIGEYLRQTDEVAGAITYGGVRDIAQRFYEIVVRADVGIIDVAWALKDQKSKEVSRLVRQQKADLKLLDEEFREVLEEN